jgi:L-ascorbate metabolism protein UlaG (beta-lactamase superfamily)
MAPKTIIDFHYKSGNDNLTLPWIKRALRDMVTHAKSIADIVYSNHHESLTVDDMLSRIKYPNF